MPEYEIQAPKISTNTTSGLTTIMQIVDITPNDLFSMGDSTTDTDIVKLIFPLNEIPDSGFIL